jgi:hypothetical protein
MIRYLVTFSEERAVADASARGWTRIAHARFVTEGKDEYRMVRRFTDLVPIPGGKTQMVRSSDYDTAPVEYRSGDPTPWAREKAGFEGFVEQGHGEWVE